jgi:hypothetical protein
MYKSVFNREEQRNPSHMLWCSTMLLLRTLNSNMLDAGSDVKGSTMDQQTYLKKLLNFMQAQGLTDRIYGYFCYVMIQP